jgi:transposase
MSIHASLPDPTNLQLDRLVSDRNGITILVRATRPEAACPLCGQISTRVHSRYVRTVHDLPWQGIKVRLRLSTRRFFCANPNCERAIFTERLPALVAPYARRTKRLAEALYLIGYALGGEAGARLAVRLGMTVSPDTLLRQVRFTANSLSALPRVVGVDDWAFSKGQQYGTILVDLEQHCVVDLLSDRAGESLATWLKARPGVEVISRDRAEGYADGARRGAPQARQVADRWHLLKNLADAVERLLSRLNSAVRTAAKRALSLPSASEPDKTVTEVMVSPTPVNTSALESRRRREQRLARYTQVMELFRRGLRVSQIAQMMSLDRKTVRKWIRSDGFPELSSRPSRTRQLNPFTAYLRQRWSEGCHNAAQLWREITAQGYAGCVSVVRGYLTRWRTRLPAGPRRTSGPKATRSPTQRIPSPRSATWFLLKPPDEKQPEKAEFQKRFVQTLCELCPKVKMAQELAQQFLEIVRERQTARLEPWLQAVGEAHSPELQSFARGLRLDLDAVVAALTEEWSNGQVEGQVHRLKLIKRSMYGRAKFDLLRARVLPAV